MGSEAVEHPVRRPGYSASSSRRRKAPAPTTSPPAPRTRAASGPSEVTTVSEPGSGWRATIAATSSSAASRPARRAKRTATREPPPASWERPSKITVTGSSWVAAKRSNRSTSRRCAPRRSRHQPSGREPMTLLPSTIHSAMRADPSPTSAGRLPCPRDRGGPTFRPIRSARRSPSSVQRMTGLARAVRTVVRRCLAVAPGENVLVVVDEPLQDVGEALRREAQDAQGDAVLAVMSPRENHGVEPPPPIAEAFAACDVFIAPASRSLSHTQARKRATDNGARGATMPTVTADMLSRLMDVDFDVLAARSRAVTELLTTADEAHVTCPRGTDLRLDLSGRQGIADDGDLTAPGSFGNLPCGEGFVAPLSADGTVATRSLASIGLVQGHPAHLTIEGGRLTKATGPEGERLYELLTGAGEQGSNLAELGVGTNDRAQLTGNVLEDEKILGTIHVAFGASAGIGGTVAVPIHLDVVVTDATLTIGDTTVLDAGRYVL